MKKIICFKKGDFDMDQLGKLLLVVILAIILIVIVTQVIGGELTNQSDRVSNAFNIFK